MCKTKFLKKGVSRKSVAHFCQILLNWTKLSNKMWNLKTKPTHPKGNMSLSRTFITIIGIEIQTFSCFPWSSSCLFKTELDLLKHRIWSATCLVIAAFLMWPLRLSSVDIVLTSLENLLKIFVWQVNNFFSFSVQWVCLRSVSRRRLVKFILYCNLFRTSRGLLFARKSWTKAISNPSFLRNHFKLLCFVTVPVPEVHIVAFAKTTIRNQVQIYLRLGLFFFIHVEYWNVVNKIQELVLIRLCNMQVFFYSKDNTKVIIKLEIEAKPNIVLDISSLHRHKNSSLWP